MRPDPAEYQLKEPRDLQDALATLADPRDRWTPIAGGTDLMVQYAAGVLASHKFISVGRISELRRIEILPAEIRIGAACTFTDVRENEIIRREFSLLSQVAGWTGAIANQNRGTLGGNIANASPAGDSLPALLAYDAELTLVSGRGERRIPYRDFHTSYKKTALAPGELIRSVCLPRRFSEYVAHARKVGTRNAQAIAKVCIAALGRTTGDRLEDIRIAVGSVAPFPIRLSRVEQTLQGRRLDERLIRSAAAATLSEARPIDDIRSTARYRGAVAANLVAEFLEKLACGQPAGYPSLSRWNALPVDSAVAEILPCCGSRAWAHRLAIARPFSDAAALLSASDEIWNNLGEADWDEAFRSHPRLGETQPAAVAAARSLEWSAQEQHEFAGADEGTQMAVAAANRAYERKFGRIFVHCAAGKSAAEILEALRRRMRNDPRAELREAAEQQRHITRMRLQKWLQE